MIKISDNQGVNTDTGEVIEFKHSENRSERIQDFGITLSKLRDLILTNVVDVDKCYFITLTYKKEKITQKELNYDINKFISRLKRKYGEFEYINVVEIQGRGTWHCHLILIFNSNINPLENIDIEKCWELGFTTTRQIDSAESVARYLTNYVFNFQDNIENQNETYKDKKQIKAERIAMYPPKFNLYRCSRGIKKPEVIKTTYKKCKEQYSLGEPEYRTGMLCGKNCNGKNFITVENYKIKNKEDVY